MQSHPDYFDFEAHWHLFVPFLNDPRIVSIRRWICKQALHSGGCDKAFLESVAHMTDEEKAIAMDAVAWGKHAWYGIFCASDVHTWVRTARDEYDDPMTLGHYFMAHNCHLMACFVWALCRKVYPDKRFQIVWTHHHGFVVDETGLKYDILATAAGEPICKEDTDEVLLYEHPLVFLPRTYWGVQDARMTAEEMERVYDEESLQEKAERDLAADPSGEIDISIARSLYDSRMGRKRYSIALALDMAAAFGTV